MEDDRERPGTPDQNAKKLHFPSKREEISRVSLLRFSDAVDLVINLLISKHF